MKALRDGAGVRAGVFSGLVLLIAGLWVRDAAAGQCISEEASAALTCKDKQLTASGKHRGPLFKAPAADPPSQGKEIAPQDPGRRGAPPERGGRKLKKQSRKYLLREIATVSDLLRATPKKSPEHPRLMRRLADNYAELEADLFTEQVQTKSKKRAKEIERRVGKARGEAIKLYKRLAAQHPKFCLSPQEKNRADRECTDQALYYLAYEYELAHDYDKARDVYYRIVKKWPKSKYVPHAYLAFGELFFNEAQGDPDRWAQAEQAYLKVIAYKPPDNPFFGYAHYKLAYVHWNQHQHDKALDHFRAVIEYGMQYDKLPNVQGLLTGARRDIVAVYAMVGDAKKAYAFFKPLSGDTGTSSEKTFAMMEDLGQSLMDTGHYAEAQALYGDLIGRNPGQKVCSYQSQIAKCTLALESAKKPAIQSALAKQLAAYLSNRDAGYPAAVKNKCAAATASLLTETAMIWHLEAVGSGDVRGTNDEKTMDAALALYDMVSANFSAADLAKLKFPHIVKEDWPTLSRVRYAQADLLFARKRWKECGLAFYRAYQADENGKDAAEALFASGQCWQNAVLETKGAKNYRSRQGLDGKDASYEARDFDEDERLMLEAFDRYACRITPPKDDSDALEKFCEVKYARAHTYYDAKHFDKAAIAFRDLAINHASCEASADAANLYLESLEVMRQKWKRAACVTNMSADTATLVELHCKSAEQRKENGEQCDVLERVNRDVGRLDIERQIENIPRGDPDAAKKLSDAGDRYWKMWEKHGRQACIDQTAACDGYEEILFNAARAYSAAGLLAKGISVRRVLVDPKYHLEKTDPARRSLYDLGANHQAIAVYDLAANWYERFASENPQMDKAATALSDAVVLRLGLGQSDQALEDAKLFADTFGTRKPTEAAQIAFAIGAHHVAHGEWDKAEKTLSAAQKQMEAHSPLDLRVQAYALLGRVYEAKKETAKADKFYGMAEGYADKMDKLGEAVAAVDGTKAERARRLGKALTAIGEALYYFAEKERARAAAFSFPKYSGSGTEADVELFITNKVLPWLKQKKPAIEKATHAYLRIVALNGDKPPPRWAIAAGAAIGAMWAELVDDFMDAPYPKEWDSDGYVPNVDPPLLYAELKAIYQNKLKDEVKPYEKVAKNAYIECLEYGIIYQYFDGELRSCEEYLGKHYPAEFHIVDELSGTPTRVNSGLDERPQALAMDGDPVASEDEEEEEEAATKPEAETSPEN